MFLIPKNIFFDKNSILSRLFESYQYFLMAIFLVAFKTLSFLKEIEYKLYYIPWFQYHIRFNNETFDLLKLYPMFLWTLLSLFIFIARIWHFYKLNELNELCTVGKNISDAQIRNNYGVIKLL